MGAIASIQPLVIGITLIYAGAGKLASAQWLAQARQTPFARIVPAGRVGIAYRLLGSVELAVGLLLLAPPASMWETVLATSLILGFAGYLVGTRLVWGEHPCAGAWALRPLARDSALSCELQHWALLPAARGSVRSTGPRRCVIRPGSSP
ncbi:MAG: hypothetical protein Kow0010_22730 [Dehalococcoidia bacterium]